MPCFAAGNQRMFDRWVWRLMAACVCLKCSPTNAAAKVNKSRLLSRPPSNTSLRNSCYHLAEKPTDIPLHSECAWDMWDSNQHTHSLTVATLAISSPSKCKQKRLLPCPGWSYDLRTLFGCVKQYNCDYVVRFVLLSARNLNWLLTVLPQEILLAYHYLQYSQALYN